MRKKRKKRLVITIHLSLGGMKTTTTRLSSYLAPWVIYLPKVSKNRYYLVFSFLTTGTHAEKKEAHQRWRKKLRNEDKKVT